MKDAIAKLTGDNLLWMNVQDGFNLYSWPEFWHLFGNKFPMRDHENHRRHQYHLRFCTYCAIEVLAEALWFSDAGVRANVPESGKSQWADWPKKP